MTILTMIVIHVTRGNLTSANNVTHCQRFAQDQASDTNVTPEDQISEAVPSVLATFSQIQNGSILAYFVIIGYFD